MYSNSNNNGMVKNYKEMTNNNMTKYQPSNLIRVQKNFYDNKIISLKFNLNNEYYILKIQKIESSSSILFTCQKEDDITLLYEYSCLLTFQDLHDMNKNFQVCDNINQIFNSFKTILINFQKISKPTIYFLNDDALLFFFRSPLISGQIEDTSIILQKKKRDIKSQFDKLVNQYEYLKNHFQNIKNQNHQYINQNNYNQYSYQKNYNDWDNAYGNQNNFNFWK